MILPTSFRSLLGRRKARSRRRSSGSIAGERQETRDVVDISGAVPRRRVQQSTRDRNGRSRTNCPDMVRLALGSGRSACDHPGAAAASQARRAGSIVAGGSASLPIFCPNHCSLVLLQERIERQYRTMENMQDVTFVSSPRLLTRPLALVGPSTRPCSHVEPPGHNQ